MEKQFYHRRPLGEKFHPELTAEEKLCMNWWNSLSFWEIYNWLVEKGLSVFMSVNFFENLTTEARGLVLIKYQEGTEF